MFSPIKADEVSSEPCAAHLIPDELRVSNVTVISEKHFDNKFGTRNDSVLVRLVENVVNEVKDVEIAFYDQKMEVMLHKSIARAKTTVKHNLAGARVGEVYLDHLNDDLKRRVDLGIGTVMRVQLYSPNETEQARTGLSMLHSAFLTMYHHFNREYVAQPHIGFVRTTLQEAIRERLTSTTFDNGLQVFLSGHQLLRNLQPASVANALIEYSFSKSPHPVWKLVLGSWSCFVVLLQYHQKYLATCLLPGFGSNALANWSNLAKTLAAPTCMPTRASIKVFDPKVEATARIFWAEKVQQAMGNC